LSRPQTMLDGAAAAAAGPGLCSITDTAMNLQYITLLELIVLVEPFRCLLHGLMVVQSHYRGEAEFYVCQAADGACQLTLSC